MMTSRGRYGGPEKRRSPRYDKMFKVLLTYDGKTYQIRTVNISLDGVQLPRRIPPPVGTQVKLAITIREETAEFEGFVVRHAQCLVNGVKTASVGIEVPTPGYSEFVEKRIFLK